MSSNGIKAEEVTFTDVSDKYWAQENILRLVELGIINGYEDNTFRSEDSLTYEQFTKMLIMAVNPSFEARESEIWSEPYFEEAIERGIIEDDYDMATRLDSISREEISTMVVRALHLNYSEEMYAIIKGDIKDIDSANEENIDSIITAYEYGIITGYANKEFKPKDKLSRAEAATVILRVVDDSVRQKYTFQKNYTVEKNLNGEVFYTETSGNIHEHHMLEFEENADCGYRYNDDGTFTFWKENRNYGYMEERLTVEESMLITRVFNELVDEFPSIETYDLIEDDGERYYNQMFMKITPWFYEGEYAMTDVGLAMDTSRYGGLDEEFDDYDILRFYLIRKQDSRELDRIDQYENKEIVSKDFKLKFGHEFLCFDYLTNEYSYNMATDEYNVGGYSAAEVQYPFPFNGGPIVDYRILNVYEKLLTILLDDHVSEMMEIIKTNYMDRDQMHSFHISNIDYKDIKSKTYEFDDVQIDYYVFFREYYRVTKK